MRRTLSPEDLASMKAMYLDNKLANTAIATRFGLAKNTVATIAKREGWPARGSWWRFGMDRKGTKRNYGEVFCGMANDVVLVESVSLEQAKTKLRQRGRVVFNATVDGSGSKGLVKCDGQLYTEAQIVEMAAL